MKMTTALPAIKHRTNMARMALLMMLPGVLLGVVVAASQASARTTARSDGLTLKLQKIIAESGAESVAVAFQDPSTGRKIMLNERVSFHAASTMKVPVMLEIFRQVSEGRFSLDKQLAVKNDFTSIADGSRFSVSAADDSEPTLYKKIGGTVSVRELMRLMITESSNLATNLLIELVTPRRVMELMREYGATDIRVRRGVEDGKAFERGLNNTTTARDLLILLRRIAEGRAVSRQASREMVNILLAQKFNEGIPAGLPAGTRVAHKTGSITKINHDAGIVYPPGRRRPYVLVVLTRGLADETRAHQLIADISRMVYDEVVAGKTLK